LDRTSPSCGVQSSRNGSPRHPPPRTRATAPVTPATRCPASLPTLTSRMPAAVHRAA